MGIRGKRPLSAPSIYQPAASLRENVVDTFFEMQEQVGSLIEKARAVNLNRIRFASP